MKLIGIAAASAVACLAAPALAVTPPPIHSGPTPLPPEGSVTAPVQPARPLLPTTTTEGEIVTSPLRAPRRAFEVGADVGYTQGFGAVRSGSSVRDLAGAGIGIGVQLGYRATPVFSIAATGQFQEFNPSTALPSGTAVRGALAGVEGTFHLAPYERADPWISVGGGYRTLWEVPTGAAPTTLTHGFELAKITAGVDVRPSENVAVAPMVGADVDMFMWQKSTGVGNAQITSRGVSTYLFAGVRGRFDVGGTRESQVLRRSE